MNDIFGIDTTRYLLQILESAGIRLKTISGLYFNQSGIGGFGIVFGNTFGMILAHILLILFTICAIVGLIVIVGGIRSWRKNHKMDPHEKWLKTGKM